VGTQPTVLLTDGEQRATLALTRSLGRAGYSVYVCSASGKSLAGASRHCRGDYVVPDPLSRPGDFVLKVEELSRQVGAGLVIPVTEAALLNLLSSSPACREIIPFPTLEQVVAICNKGRVLSVAPEVGIAVPTQVEVRSVEEARRIDPQSLVYPLVIKPSRSVSGDGDARIKLGVSHVASPADLGPALRQIPSAGFPVMLQQRIVGPGVGVFLLIWNGVVLAEFSHRRIREKPPAGGVSVYRESIAADPALMARSRALLERFQWQGVAMVEYKMDVASGTPYLMEINGRFWGSLQLAIDSGVNFPRLLAEAATGTMPAPVCDYRTGVRSRWWWGDVDHLIAMLRGSRASLGLPPGAPGRWRTLLDFLKLWRPGDRNEVFRWNDPRPFFRETMQWLRGR
jgi:predicted ATP-grasp superfamily ATP-dependent carboligase